MWTNLFHRCSLCAGAIRTEDPKNQGTLSCLGVVKLDCCVKMQLDKGYDVGWRGTKWDLFRLFLDSLGTTPSSWDGERTLWWQSLRVDGARDCVRVCCLFLGMSGVLAPMTHLEKEMHFLRDSLRLGQEEGEGWGRLERLHLRGLPISFSSKYSAYQVSYTNALFTEPQYKQR